MYKDKLKSTLFEKIREHNQVETKISNIENRYPNLSFDELVKQDLKGYSELCRIKLELESQIDELMIDTKYILLPDLTNWEKQELDTFAIAPSLDNDKNIEKHLDFQLINYKDSMKNRLGKIKSTHLTININPRIYHLYRQAIRCYVSGFFEAICVLCRAISETIAKEYIKNIEKIRNVKLLYEDKKQKNNSLSIAKILKQESVDKKAVDSYYKIGRMADDILHKEDKVSKEEEAHKTIIHLQNFIKKFHKITDFEIEEV